MTCTICNQMPCICKEEERSMALLLLAANARDEAEDKAIMAHDLVKRETAKHTNCKCYRKKFSWPFKKGHHGRK